MPLFKTFYLLQLLSLVSAIVWNEPTQTAWRAEPVGAFVGQTAAPALRRRDDPPDETICGYFPGELDGAFTCSSSGFCGFDQVNTMFGCCTFDAAGTSAQGCGQQTTCYQTIQTSSASTCSDDHICCDQSCQTDTGAVFCTDAASPSCVKYQYSFPAVVYSAFGCSDVPGTFEVYSTFVASAPKSLAYTSSSSNEPPIVSSQSQSTNIVSISIAPTATQKTIGSQSTTNILPTSTKSGAAVGPHPRRWQVEILCGFLGALLAV